MYLRLRPVDEPSYNCASSLAELPNTYFTPQAMSLIAKRRRRAL